MTEPFVVCDNLVKIYKVADLEVVALQGLDLMVEPGEMMGIVGSSGSGKSTLLNILGGLDRPSAGRVFVGGTDLLKLSDVGLTRYRRSQVGFVWQQTSRNLIPYLTARENVELPMTIAGYSARRKRERSEELLAAIGLSDRARHRLAQMSGGEQQRVGIAVALAHEPTLLLADEPTGEMDTMTAQTIFETLRRINEAYGLTTIIVTHDPRIAGQVDRVVAIRDGRTSSEIVRQVSQIVKAMVGDASATGSPESEEETTVHYEEYVVLDGAGRLQLPREYLERLGIRGRATVELAEEGILVKPTDR
jgi:ABC-type lipoprotein export system ATPase subunit